MINIYMPRMSTVPSLIQECEGVGVVPVNWKSLSTVSPPSNVCTVSSTSTSRRQFFTADEKSIKQRSKKVFQTYDVNKRGIMEDTIERRIGSSTTGKMKQNRKEVQRRDEVFRIRRGEIAEDVEEGMEEDGGGIYEMEEEMNHRFSHSSVRTTRLAESDFGTTRKNNKPQMEKKRRQREKQSLNQLREYVLTAYKVDPSRYMDKAEILEKTVKFMQHIMKKYYPADEKDCNNEFRLSDSATCRSDIETENTTKQNEIKKLKLNFVNNYRQSELSHPSMNEQVVTLIIPQLGSNFQATPQVMQNDNCNNYWSVGQAMKEHKVVNNNSLEKSTSFTSPTLKFVVNHNYYMNSAEQLPCDAVSTASDESYSREVLSPDTTTGNLNQYKYQGGSTSSIINPVSLATYPDFISSTNHPIIAPSQRRIAPKLKDNLCNRNNQQFGHNLSLVAQQLPSSNTLHRPWEK